MNGAGIHSAALIKVQLILSLFIFFTYSPQTIAATTRDQRSLYSAQFHVAPNEAKLVVSIVSYFRNIVQYCSGTLLTDTVVLTAAHCLYREDAGLADNVRVTNEGWTSYARELVLRRDFVQLPAHKSICADMALVILPNRVTGFTGPFGIKFAQLSPAQLLAEGQAAEIFALGYGITEFNRISLLPRKVPMQLVKGDAECTLNFLFSHSAISCSGDSGGPVLYYPKNGTKAKGTATTSHNKTPVYLGLSSQIAIYEDDWELNNNLLHPAPPTVGAAGGVATVNKQLHQDVEDCKRASELVLLQTYYIQNWLIMLIRNEKQQMRKQLYQEALNSLIGQSQ